jgi:hypothetical protein
MHNDITKSIVIPIDSVKFLDDLSVAYAWLIVNGYDIGMIFDYLSYLHKTLLYQIPRQVSPLTALQIPGNAADSPAVSELSQEILEGALTWILSYHLGHLYYGHHVYNFDPSHNWNNTVEADHFALDIMRRLKRLPYGVVLLFQISAATFLTRSDFDNDEDWKSYLARLTTLPLKDRLSEIADYLEQYRADFAPAATGQVGASEEYIDRVTKLLWIITMSHG